MTTEHLQAANGRWISLGALLAMLAVMLGAFGAHGLKNHFSDLQMAWYQTAFQYHVIHAIALIITGLTASVTQARRRLDFAGYGFLAGIVLFSGSLYLMSLTQSRWLGAITPIGGVAFIAGWAMLASAGFKPNDWTD